MATDGDTKRDPESAPKAEPLAAAEGTDGKQKRVRPASTALLMAAANIVNARNLCLCESSLACCDLERAVGGCLSQWLPQGAALPTLARCFFLRSRRALVGRTPVRCACIRPDCLIAKRFLSRC